MNGLPAGMPDKVKAPLASVVVVIAGLAPTTSTVAPEMAFPSLSFNVSAKEIVPSSRHPRPKRNRCSPWSDPAVTATEVAAPYVAVLL